MKESITNAPKHVLSERSEVKQVSIFLNSGQTFYVICKEAKFTVDQKTGKVLSYVFTGMHNPDEVNIRLDAIVAYTIRTVRV
ncbi:hypothetical protein MCCARTNEY_220 [Bacillus phage vB_BanH_McCartney]|nr:hypothetical protein MCCARTNEY_220 [Bacillus phage vB_BanH_McCartney]